MTNHARFVDKASERVCMTNVNGFVDRLQEEEYLYMGVCACTSRDLQLYMPLMLPCFIDQDPWTVARVY